MPRRGRCMRGWGLEKLGNASTGIGKGVKYGYGAEREMQRRLHPGRDQIWATHTIPPLADLIMQAAHAAHLGDSWTPP